MHATGLCPGLQLVRAPDARAGIVFISGTQAGPRGRQCAGGPCSPGRATSRKICIAAATAAAAARESSRVVHTEQFPRQGQCTSLSKAQRGA